MSQNLSNPARVAVVGAGYWGKNLVRNHHLLGSLAVICDPDPEIRETMAKTYPDISVVDDMEAVLNNPDISALVISTPAATHGRMVKRALLADKHVFIEKPLCLNVSEAEILADMATERGLVLMVGHLLLYHPAFIALKSALVEGRLGKLRYIYSNRLSLGKIRREENALWSFAPHDISMILSLVGDTPKSIVCNGGNYLHSQVADTSLSHLSFSNDIQAHVFVSWLHPYKDQRLVVVGDLGMAEFNDVNSGTDKLLFYPHNIGWNGQMPVVNKANAEPIPYHGEEPLRNECQAFIDAVSKGITPPSNSAEGIRVLRVLDACQQALAGGTRIELNT
jgi:UDP-2-acetamido-3-amino-2,3-dideoxy-glucuronate N-acetyltransferase